jgi:ABC-type multidrug transport system permease subunit
VRKLLKRLRATPMRRSHFVLTHGVVRLAFVAFELAVLLAFGRLAFGVTVAGSLLSVLVIALAGAMSFSGLATLVASRAENTQTASGLLNLFIMPMFIFSGVFFASNHFPDAMQPFIRALPLTALNDALRAVMIDGSSLVRQWRELLVLAVWGVVGFSVGLRIFKWK